MIVSRAILQVYFIGTKTTVRSIVPTTSHVKTATTLSTNQDIGGFNAETDLDLQDLNQRIISQQQSNQQMRAFTVETNFDQNMMLQQPDQEMEGFNAERDLDPQFNQDQQQINREMREFNLSGFAKQPLRSLFPAGL
jgi:uncharacterized protein YdgA (DUF945 family)